MNPFQYAARQLRQSPAFTLTAILTLALGIGATAAIFSAVYALLLKSLPYADADRLIAIASTHPQVPGALEATFPDYQDWTRQQSSFTELAAYSVINPTTVSVIANGHPQQLHQVLASGNFFSLLGVQPLLGRNLTPSDDTPASAPVAILSHSAWQQYFGADPNVLNHPVDINGSAITIIGILPAGAAYPVEGEIFLPLSRLDPATRTSRVWHSVRVIGRLRPGTSLTKARTDISNIAARLAAQYPATNHNVAATLTPLREQLVGAIRPAIITLLVAVLLVLFIACANVANLLLVRAASQRRSIAVRRALGASQSQLFTQSLAQTLLLSLLGGALGLVLAAAFIPLLRTALAHITTSASAAGSTTIAPSLLDSVSLNLPVLAAAFLICTLTAILFSLLPALHRTPDLVVALRPTGSESNSSPRRTLLVAGEIAIAVSVLFLGSLLLRSYQKLAAINPGFATDHLLTAEITLPTPRYGDSDPATNRFYEQLINTLSSSPAVLRAATTNQTPLQPSQVMTRLLIEGTPAAAPGVFPVAQMRFVSPSYFDTLGLRLLNGRPFTREDTTSDVNHLIVNQAFADRFLQNRNPVGATVLLGVLTPHPDKCPVVGVVENARDLGVATPPQPEIYFAGYGTHAVLLIRSRVEATTLIPTLREAVSTLDPSQPIYKLATADNLLSDSLARWRLTALLLSLFSAVALLLAAIGIYGVLSVSVAQRTREIGVRMAIGATRGNVLRLILGQASRFTAIGLITGLAISILSARLLSTQLTGLLFETRIADPISIALTLAALTLIATIASILPAHRASKTNPAETLRAE